MGDEPSVMLVVGGLNLNDVNFIRSYAALLRNLSRLTVLRCDTEEAESRDGGYREVCMRVASPANLAGRMVSHVAMQLRFARRIVAEERMDAYIFFQSESLFIPIALVRLLGRRAVVAPGSSSRLLFASRPTPDVRLVMHEERLGYHLCTDAILYSDRLVDEWDLSRFREKVVVCPRHYVGEDLFSVARDYAARDCVIGYVGRLSREKGVLNLVHAVPAILQEVPEASFRLVGDGELRPEIEAFINANDLGDRVELCGWVDHARLGDALNDARVLVLPSETEGLPNVVLEAMACGVVVVANPVGSVPDLIEDGETGFLLDANDASSIARTVAAVLRRPDLAEVSKRASRFIEEEYRFRAAEARYRTLLAALVRPRRPRRGS